MNRLIALTICIMCLVMPGYAAEKKVCTREEAIEAENEIDKLKDWDSLYNSFKRFSHCDDGAIGEGYSATVSSFLAHDWKHFTRLYRLTLSDKEFKRFILKHLDETVPIDEARTIKLNSLKHCPSEAKSFCNLISCKLLVTAEMAEPSEEISSEKVSGLQTCK